MRVLILSALFACASAAPSGLFAPAVVAPAVVAVPGVPVNSGDLQGALIDAKVQTEDFLRSVAEKQREVLRPAVVAPAVVAPAVVAVPGVPVNSGDLQGALIDAKVQTEDFLRSVADKQREVVEQAVVDTNEKVIEANDQIQEKAVETFWADQEKKWQAYDAVQTAQAQLEGSIAATSDVVAKSVVVPGVNAVVAPYVVAPGVAAPIAKVAAPETPKPEEPMPEQPKAEETKAEEKPEELKSDSIQVESASVKTAEVTEKEASLAQPKYVVGQTPLVAAFPLSPLGLVPQTWAPVVAPGLKTIVPFGHVIAPTVVKTVW